MAGALGGMKLEPEKFEELCKRAVKAHHWRWMPGMLNTAGTRILTVDEDGYMLGIPPGWTTLTVVDIFHPPNLKDSATSGCILDIVRKAHKQPLAVPIKRSEKWAVYYPIGSESWVRMSSVVESEAEALVAALEKK